MSYYEDYTEFNSSRPKKSYHFDMSVFDQELKFANFDAQATVEPNYDLLYGNISTTEAVRSFYDRKAYPSKECNQDKRPDISGDSIDDYNDEPPLLEELGINPNQIFQKVSLSVLVYIAYDYLIFLNEAQTLAVLNPMRAVHHQILQDTDMAGPLVFCLALGGFLLLNGKVTFSYIYGIGVMGCIGFYVLLTLMASHSKVTFGAVVSVLGYCLLPMVVLSGINVLLTIQGSTVGIATTGVCIVWCALSASKLFVTAYSMDNQQILIAYPCALLYGVFALIIIF
uniref:Protein YIPF n=1 Tax=Glossina pallidipes TaxID=7398 RepID=A0A1B0A0R6_GLOPL